MYVKRLKLYDVNGFRFDLPRDGGELPQATRNRMLLQGGNGSGKTTVIKTIAGLWEWFGKMIDERNSTFSFPDSSRWSAELNAMQLGDFPRPGQDLWIAVGTLNGIDALKKSHAESPIAFLQRRGKDYHIELPAGDWEAMKVRSQEGVEPLPNIVHFPPESRSMATAPRGGVKRLDLYEQYWLATFDAGFDLDSLLFTIRAKQPDRHAEAMRLFNQMLAPASKRVSAMENRNGRLHIERFEGPRQQPYLWTGLSSGERQMLLLVVYTVCLLREESILVIDEPDLHIHIGMVAQLMETLERVVRERNGQLIVASHSQLIWNWYSLKAEKIQLSPWRGGNS
jgi:energy-coupling factor transporter ATP-binding protein EcfA2